LAAFEPLPLDDVDDADEEDDDEVEDDELESAEEVDLAAEPLLEALSTAVDALRLSVR